ncbi:MAG: RuBisCO large subunit C-terminal-like domain-containing protein [Pelosinus sp.]|nr:RuBisCO large subunit C-terminal-like domain-containing protein [Pelosinus sp.]
MVSGERFLVEYLITGDEAAAYAKVQDICVEQTVEFPPELIRDTWIKEDVVGKIENFEYVSNNLFKAVISYAVETTAYELTQLLNVIYGNISLKPGILVNRLDLSLGLLSAFHGPRFGREGLRKLLQAEGRPLLFTAIKPMGLSAAELGRLAYKFACGGIDIIKDDHGLTNQPFAEFTERIKYAAAAVNKANLETGGKSIYVANITGPSDEVIERARLAKRLGAKGLMVAPALIGFDTMRLLAEDNSIALPIFSHPAFLGSFTASETNGISHYVLYGQITRLAGADATIYPNFGGRFSFSKQICESITAATAVPMGKIKPIFPSPGGGITLPLIPELLEVYGEDVIFLMGGGLVKRGPDIEDNCRYFRQLIEGSKAYSA